MSIMAYGGTCTKGISIPDEVPPRGHKMGTGKGMGPSEMGAGTGKVR